MSNGIKAPHNIVWIIFFLYFLPTTVLSIYSVDLIGKEPGWGVLSLGLLQAAAGSIILYSLLRQWEQIPAKIIEIPAPSNDEELKTLQAELVKKGEELSSLYTNKESLENEIRKKDSLLNDFQETVARQRDVLKKRQAQVSELESKIHHISAEVGTLLNTSAPDTSDIGMELKETAAPYLVNPSLQLVTSPSEAEQQLKKCLTIASKITGANHFEEANSRFRQWHIDNYALDLRRLFDHLRGESSSTIFVFSQKDNRLLFVNNQSKHLLGWTPEKFIQNFSEIIEESLQEWNRSISRLAGQSETTGTFTMKSKSGEKVYVDCHLGVIGTGLFKNHIIGVIYAGQVQVT